MVSRRTFLAGAVGFTGSLCGCLTESGVANTGYLQFKYVEVSWRYDGQQYHDDILFASYDGETQPWCRVAEEYQSLVNSVDDVRVTDTLVNSLGSTFDNVRYVIGFCWADGTCRNPTATRKEFNRVQFGDRAEVVLDHPGVHIIDVYQDANADLDSWDEVNTTDFSTLHAEHGVQIA